MNPNDTWNSIGYTLEMAHHKRRLEEQEKANLEYKEELNHELEVMNKVLDSPDHNWLRAVYGLEPLMSTEPLKLTLNLTINVKDNT